MEGRDGMNHLTRCASGFVAGGLIAMVASNPAQAAGAPLPFAAVQAVPMPHVWQVSFQHDARELVRYHYGPQLERPFWFPLIGPTGRVVTRMGHPHDPTGHSHHNSVWISHQKVNGINFWEDPGPAKIVHHAIEELTDGPGAASLRVRNAWLAPDGQAILTERRHMTVRTLANGEWMLTVELLITPAAGDVTFGKTSFGLFAARVAKSMSVNDGGGTIRNSAGAVNEKAVFWKPARWVDYSGPITADRTNGITLLDHTANPNHPSVFHVRNDGWMGASFSFNGPFKLPAGRQLRLLYALYIHDGAPLTEQIERRFAEFTNHKHEIK
jgi:hypothetical protein